MNDAESIKAQIAALPAPFEINGVDLEFGLDSTGDPAMWIYLHVEDNESWDFAAELARYAQTVELAILAQNDGRVWPYVHFRSP